MDLDRQFVISLSSNSFFFALDIILILSMGLLIEKKIVITKLHFPLL